MGELIFNQNRDQPLSQIRLDGVLDDLVKRAKQKGGNRLMIQVGIEGEPELFK